MLINETSGAQEHVAWNRTFPKQEDAAGQISP